MTSSGLCRFARELRNEILYCTYCAGLFLIMNKAIKFAGEMTARNIAAR